MITIPIKVKHKDGSISKYAVIRKNILHKTVVNPVKMRQQLIDHGILKPSEERLNISSGEDVCSK